VVLEMMLLLLLLYYYDDGEIEFLFRYLP